jgi:hypothetical protein
MFSRHSVYQWGDLEKHDYVHVADNNNNNNNNKVNVSYPYA